MQISGTWFLCDDAVVRPVIFGEVQASGGNWVKTPFLVDIAADRTVFSADILEAIGPAAPGSPLELGGVGGKAASVALSTAIRLCGEDEKRVLFRGEYAAMADIGSLDMSVLGRDVTNLFAVIADRPGNVVCLLGQRHGYLIVQR